MSTETPLNARQWPKAGFERDRMSHDLAQSADGKLLTAAMQEVCREYVLDDGQWQCERCAVADALLIQLAAHKAIENVRRAVLAEAERALRERAQEEVVEIKIAPHDSVGQGMAIGAHDAFVEAADLLAGMRRCACDRVDCDSCGPRIAKRVTEGA